MHGIYDKSSLYRCRRDLLLRPSNRATVQPAVAGGAGRGWRAERHCLSEIAVKAVAGLFAGLCLLLLSACGTQPTDYPLAVEEASPPQPVVDVNPAHPLVVLAISGGGS